MVLIGQGNKLLNVALPVLPVIVIDVGPVNINLYPSGVGIPPDTLAEITPVLPPLQSTLIIEVTLPDIGVGSVMVNIDETTEPVPSVICTV